MARLQLAVSIARLVYVDTAQLEENHEFGLSSTSLKTDDTDAVLRIDTSNAFSALNRATALHNIRVLCPVIAVYAINTYREPARLFITGGKEIAEGTTRALIRRALKRAGPSKKVWCSRLGSTKTRRFHLLTLELGFRKKLHETPFYVNQELFYCIFVLWQWEKVSFSGMKQDL